VRGANDLVWVGRAANYAAKLSSLPDAFATYITKEVYDAMANEMKIFRRRPRDVGGCPMEYLDDRTLYRSEWWWRVP